MLGARLLQLIQAHAGSLTNEVIVDLRTNERTPSFGQMSLSSLEARIGALFSNLGRWIGDSDESAIRAEYDDMGRRRFQDGIPLSEIVYGLLLTKQHLRRYIRDHGLIDFAGDRTMPDELLPLELHSIQELNYQVGEFFDRALYHLARGFEAEAAGSRSHAASRLSA
jgi:hypothetical protein